MVKNPPANAEDIIKVGSVPGLKIVLPGEYHGWRSLAGYSP